MAIHSFLCNADIAAYALQNDVLKAGEVLSCLDQHGSYKNQANDDQRLFLLMLLSEFLLFQCFLYTSAHEKVDCHHKLSLYYILSFLQAEFKELSRSN